VSRLHARARALIVGGWGFVVFGSIGYFAVLVHLGYFNAGQSVAQEGTIVLPVFANGAALVAWWWLTRLMVSDDQRTFVQRAFYALSLQALFTAAVVLCEVSLAHSNGATNQLIIASLACEVVGSLAVFAGFVLLAGVYGPARELPREAPRPADLSALDSDDE
jgi:hypothetical protein